MAMKFPGTFSSANPEAFGIIFADEASGHKSVKSLSVLYSLPDAILSKSGKNSDDDAIGQIWYVRDQGKHFKLISWTDRKKSNGWEVFVAGGSSNQFSKEDLIREGGFSQLSGIRPIVDGVVSDVTIQKSSINISGPTKLGEGVFWCSNKGVFVYAHNDGSGLKYYDNWADNLRNPKYYKNADATPKQNIFLYNGSYYTIELTNEFDISSGSFKIKRDFVVFNFKTESGGGGGSKVTIIDNLTSDDKSAALSAHMGKHLDEKKVDKNQMATINGQSLLNGGADIEINLSKEPVDKGTLMSKDDIVALIKEPYGVYSGVVDDSPILLGDFPGIKNVSIPAYDVVIVEVINGSILASTTERTTVLNLQVIPSDSNYDGFTATMTSVNGKWENTECSLALANMASTLTFNQPMPTVSITGSWTFQNNASTPISIDTISPRPDETNPTLEYGYKAKFSGTYKWNSGKNTKSPKAVTEDSTFRDLPIEGVGSSTYNSEVLANSTVIKASISAPKTGLMVQGGNVVQATGNDVASTSVRVTFKHRRYYGVVSTTSINEGAIKALNNDLVDGKSGTVNGVNVNNNQYFVYAYPASLKELNKVDQGGFNVKNAFTLSTVNITNAAGKQIEYNVYISNAGAFKNENLIFS